MADISKNSKLQIHDGISIERMKIPSKMCGNSRGEGKKVDVLLNGGGGGEVQINYAISQSPK